MRLGVARPPKFKITAVHSQPIRPMGLELPGRGIMSDSWEDCGHNVNFLGFEEFYNRE